MYNVNCYVYTAIIANAYHAHIHTHACKQPRSLNSDQLTPDITTGVRLTDHVVGVVTQQRHTRVRLGAERLPAQWRPHAGAVDVVVDGLRQVGEHFARVGEASRPVVAALLGVRLVRVVEVEARGVAQHHLWGGRGEQR